MEFDVKIIGAPVPDKPTGGLESWGLFRATVGDKNLTYAAGILLFHPSLLAGRLAYTSPVLEVAADRSWLRTKSRLYELRAERGEFSEDLRREIVVTAFKIFRLFDEVAWLRTDGSTYSVLSAAEILRIMDEEMQRYDAMVTKAQEFLNARNR